MQGSDGTTGRCRAWRLAATAVIAVTALFVVAACSSGGGVVSAPKAKPTTPASPAAQVTITPANGSKQVEPATGITITAAHAKLTNVAIHTKGTQVTGSYSQGETVWHSDWTLGTSQKFLVTATAVTSAGKTITSASSFATLAPERTFTTQIFEGAGQTYGVGMPVKLTFSEPIKDKAAVERALELRSSKPTMGAWWWDGDQTLDFRPKVFWPANTAVALIGHLDGVQGAPGMYGTSNLTQAFDIGESLIVHVSTSHHNMTVYRNGRHLYTWPISSGKPGDDTPNGVFLTIDKGNPVEMKPADIKPGQPGYYDVKVNWSVRFTWSGDYIHSAPWSVGNQGSSNVSHGCVNLGPSYAPVYYNMEVPGDPVDVTGSPVHGAWDDGWTDWYLSWTKVLARSATGEAVDVGPAGSSYVSAAAPQTPGASPSPASATP